LFGRYLNSENNEIKWENIKTLPENAVIKLKIIEINVYLNFENKNFRSLHIKAF
jgi:hypothetical protein